MIQNSLEVTLPETNKSTLKTEIPIGCYDMLQFDQNHLDPRSISKIYTLPEANIAPENGWLEYDRLSFWEGKFSVAFAVSFWEGIS